jgi:polyhydroxybutyrate depolymerase
VSCFPLSGQVGNDPKLLPGKSPGPSRQSAREDHRVPLNWILQPGTFGPGNYARRMLLGGRERYYEIHVPAVYEPGVPTPVVFVLHGGGGNAAMMRFKTDFDDISDRENFLVVYAAGTSSQFTDRRLHWNAGFPTKDPKQAKVDDVGYFSAILDDLPKYFSIDTRRVYATGLSNGAKMCYRLAAELSDRIAAIAPVAGQRSLSEFAKPPARAISIIHLHGKNDDWSAYDGGPSRGTGRGQHQPYPVPPVEEAIQTWVKHNRCSPEPEVTRVGKARCLRYSGGRDGTEVVLWVLEDGGHTWPGGKVTRFEELIRVGKTNRDISASEVIWEFFQRHALSEKPVDSN